MQPGNIKQGLGTVSLVLLITGAIDSIRNLPATALSGPSLIFFFLFSAAVFLVPVALVSARLASASPDRGGIYQWVVGALARRQQCLLSGCNGSIPWSGFQPFFHLLPHSSVVYQSGARNQQELSGDCCPVDVLVADPDESPWGQGLGKVCQYLFSHWDARADGSDYWSCSHISVEWPPLQIHFSMHNVFPALTKSEHWVALTAIMTAFLGMELATVHVREIKKPEQTFPKALFFSVILILGTMIMGSLAIAFVLPVNEISLVGGVMQAFSHFFAVWHLEWMVPVMTVMLLAGSLGGVTSWIISPARGLMQAAEHGFLPTFLTHRNQHGVAHRLLVLQALLVTAVCLAFLLMPDVNGSYWLLSALSTQLYILMYVLMFVAAMRLEKQIPRVKGIFSLPGGKWATWLVCLLGMSGCVMTLVVGFVPPQGLMSAVRCTMS